MNEPTDGMAKWQSTKQVLAGEIIEVCPAGCYVKNADGDAIFREYVENMTARYTPAVGDWWIVYPDGYQSLSPARAFVDGYVPVGS
jgi:hypothetical protein